MQCKIPQKLSQLPNMLINHHAKFHFISTCIDHSIKSSKLTSRGVTQIVTPKFQNSYLYGQESKMHEIYMEINLIQSRIITKIGKNLFYIMCISQWNQSKVAKMDMYGRTLGQILFTPSTTLTNRSKKFYTSQGSQHNNSHIFLNFLQFFMNFLRC